MKSVLAFASGVAVATVAGYFYLSYKVSNKQAEKSSVPVKKNSAKKTTPRKRKNSTPKASQKKTDKE